MFETATPFDTPRLMTELVAWLDEATEAKRLHPLLIIAVFVVVFLAIHPFQDGNGRLSRILTTLLLLQAGYSYVPYSSLESVIEHSKESYYLGLRQTQGTIRTEAPNWQPWLTFFLRALQEQMQRLAKKVEREKLVVAALPEMAAQIIDHARNHGRVTMGDMIRITGSSRNTLKEHFRRLVELGHLKMHGTGKGGRALRMALHAKARKLARSRGIRARRSIVPVPRSAHPGQIHAQRRNRCLGARPQCQSRQSQLALHNSKCSDQAQAPLPCNLTESGD